MSGRVKSASLMCAALLLSVLVYAEQPVAAGPSDADPPWVWRQIGPAPLRQDSVGLGGVVYDLAIDPRGTSDRIMYIATNGGIWKTTDGGATWSPKTDSMPSNSMGAVALDPNNPDIVYAGTGTLIDPLGINFRADGVYRSTDGGDTWRVRGRSTFGSVAGCAATRNNQCGLGISRIVVLPGSPNVVIAGTNNGLFRSTDSGLSWSAVTIPGAPNPNVTDLDVDTSLNSFVYASVAGVGIFRSADGGSTFTRNLLLRPGGPPAGTFSSIAFAQSNAPNNRTMYALLASSAPCPSLSCPPLGIWKSFDFGRSWGALPALGLGVCQAVCSVDQSIGVDPVSPNIVHVGLIDYFISTNGGLSFLPQGIGHVDQVAITFSPTSHFESGRLASSVWVGNHGGVWKGTHPGGPVAACIPILGCYYNWTSRNEGLANLGVVYADTGRGSAANNGFTYAGIWDNGLASKGPTDPGTDWHLGRFGDGGFVTVDPNNPQRAYGSVNSVFFVTDSAGGDGWTARIGGSPPFDGPPRENPADVTDTVWRVAIDTSSRAPAPPFTSQVLYALVGPALYRSTDAGRNFNQIVVWGGANPISPVAIAISASDPDVVWLGMSDGTLYWTKDAFSTVEPPVLTGGPALPVASVAINPENSSQVVVGYGPDNTGAPTANPVWFTADSGQTWSDITGNLPALPVNSVMFDPSTSPASIIVGNDNGVMYTTDPSTGAAWSSLGTGLPTAYAMQLAHDPSAVPQLVRVGTYGRSVFQLTGPVTDLQSGLRHEFLPGGDVTYHLFITNAGFEPAIGVVGGLELDPALEYVSGIACSPPPSGSNLVTCRVAGLDASPEHGEGVQLDLIVHLKTCPPDGTVTSHWSVSSLLLSDTDPSNNDATDTIFCFPDTFIVSAVDGDGVDVPYLGKTTSASIKVTFAGSEGTASFECSLDQTNFMPCTSPATYDNLVPGEHTFQVQALDANGTPDPTPAMHAWSVV
jgi:photosystem II stability/assembly factor-like uncharacterized protein